jgi:tRNA pseudouridine38-40 synthase
MAATVEALRGEHDFLPFCIPRPGASTIRTVLEARWDRMSNGELALTIRADAFCHHMVRMIVGASVAVGEGRRSVGWLGELLASGERHHAVTVAAPHGLTLEEVAYPPAADLAAEATRARRFRGAS